MHTTKLQILTLSILLTLSFLSTFSAGYLLKTLQTDPTPKPIPEIQLPVNTPSASKHSDTIDSYTPYSFEPGLHYFDDTVIAISKQPPHQAIVATVSRKQQQGQSYQQLSRASYYNGREWSRKLTDQTTDTATIRPSILVSEWNHYIDPSRVLKEQLLATINLNDQIKIRSQSFDNEISMRSLPGYTKLVSETDGTLTINDTQFPAHIVYSKIYSLNSQDLQFYNTPLGIVTDWAVLWSQQGEFFHLDITSVENQTSLYQTHQIAIFKNQQAAIAKTFDIARTRDKQLNPSKFTYTLNKPVEKTISLTRTTQLNKAPNASYNWIMGHVNGTVSSADGTQSRLHGLVEYIND